MWMYLNNPECYSHLSDKTTLCGFNGKSLFTCSVFSKKITQRLMYRILCVKRCIIFRWFKFTLKPPYSGASERSLSAIWDTSHWNFFVKFGLRTAWDISYDILLSLLKFVNFWRLQGRLSILAKIGCLQKIKVFSMKERRGFDATWGF